MKNVIALLVLFTATAFAQPVADIDAAIAGEIGSLEALYKHLHAHPELSTHEKETSARIARELEAAGYTVTTHVGGYGVVGILRNGPGKTVLVRTDLDALPIVEKTGLPYASTVRVKDDAGNEVGVMHACGHDMHMTSFVGTARTLAKLKDQWSGTVVMIGQPAEEKVMGAKAMLKDGLFTRFPKPDYALALHVNPALEAGTIGYCPGFALANVDSVDITVRGMGGHGSQPEATKDPVVIAAQIVLALQTIVSREVSPLDSAVVTVGSIHGGTKRNIIPDEVRLYLTVRTYKDETRRKVLASIERISLNIARAAGVPADREPVVKVLQDETTPAVYNDPALAKRIVPAWRSMLGADNVIKVAPVMGAEDFARYGRTPEKVPIFLMWLGATDTARFQEAKRTGKRLPPLHSALFWPAIHPTIETGVKATSAAVMELLKKK